MHQVYAVGTYPTGSIVESRIEDLYRGKDVMEYLEFG